MKTVLTSHKICPTCGTEATVEVDGVLALMLMASVLGRLETDGGYLTPGCGHRFYVEPKPKKPTYFQRLKIRLLNTLKPAV